MTTTTGRRTATKPATADEPEAIQPPPKLRRRNYLWILGVLLVASGGLAAVWVANTISDTDQVIALRADVDRGSVITDDDLVTVPMAGDPLLRTIPADNLDQILGQRAARDLTAGTILVPEAVTNDIVPAEGESLIGVALRPGQLPAQDVRPGSPVRLINTPRDQDNLPNKPATSVNATVVRLTEVPDTGQYVVDVVVPTSEAPTVAALAATGRVALVVDGN